MTDMRLAGIVGQVLISSVPSEARISQEMGQVLATMIPQTRVSQVAVETILVLPSVTRVSQSVIEVARSAPGAEVSDDVGISYVGYGTELETSGAGPHTLDMPDGLLVGDFVLAIITPNADDAPENFTAGWATVPNTPIFNTLYSTNVFMFYRIIDGTEGASVSFTIWSGTTLSARIHAWRGVDPDTPFATTPQTEYDSVAEDNAIRQFMKIRGEGWATHAVAIATHRTSTNPDPPTTFPSPWTTRQHHWHNTGNWGTAIADRGYADTDELYIGNFRYTTLGNNASPTTELIIPLNPIGGGGPPPAPSQMPYVIMIGD